MPELLSFTGRGFCVDWGRVDPTSCILAFRETEGLVTENS